MKLFTPPPYIPWLPFYTLLQKEVRRFLRVASQTLITPVITASLYLFVFGATLGERIQVIDEFNYAQFVIPGLIMMGVINNSFSNVASSLFMSRYLGNIVDLLVTPVSPAQFIMAYTLAAMLRGLTVGCVVWLISTLFATLPWAHPLATIGMAAMASFLFAQFGIIAAIHANNFDSLAMYTNFIILPLIYLGGVFYPISILPPVWAQLSHLNPLFYLIDGFRYALLGVSDLPFTVSFGTAAGMAALLFVWAANLIRTSYRLRN